VAVLSCGPMRGEKKGRNLDIGPPKKENSLDSRPFCPSAPRTGTHRRKEKTKKELLPHPPERGFRQTKETTPIDWKKESINEGRPTIG